MRNDGSSISFILIKLYWFAKLISYIKDLEPKDILNKDNRNEIHFVNQIILTKKQNKV